MKAFIRSLNIEERKCYTYMVFYTFFQCLSVLLIKIMSQTFKIGLLTLITERGCIISLICSVRIIISIRNNKAKIEEIVERKKFKHVILRGFVNCLMYTFVLFSIYYSSLTSYFTIIKISYFLSLFISKYILKEKIQNYQYMGFFFDFIGIICIMLAIFSQENFKGILLNLIVLILYSFIPIINKNCPGSNIDILIFFMAIFSAAFGCYLMVVFSDQVFELKFGHWLMIIVCSVFCYYEMFFLIKTIKIINSIDRLVPLALIPLLFSFLIDLIFYDTEISFLIIFGFLIMTANTLFYLKEIFNSSMKRNCGESENSFIYF